MGGLLAKPCLNPASNAPLRWILLTTLLVFVCAAVPRLAAVNTHLTPDEVAYWFNRSHNFLEGMRSGDLAQTYQAEHPGVTTMWLGTLGEVAFRISADFGLVAPDDVATQRVFMRVPMTVTNALAVVAGYLLLLRLFDRRVALLAALFWATDPFLIAHSRLLHVDAPMTSFLMLSLLALLLAFGFDQDTAAEGRPIRWGMLLFSAVMGGLALLSKIPAIILPPFVALAAVASGLGATQRARRLPIRAVALWGLLALVVCVALWPVLWVEPVDTVRSYLQSILEGTARSHESNSFFLGEPSDNSSALYYVYAIAVRLTPWVSVGVFIPLIALLLQRQKLPGRTALLMIGLFALLFLIMMSIPSKKGDRYVQVVFANLNIIAAFGWVWLGSLAWQQWFSRLPGVQARYAATGLVALCVLGLAVHESHYLPYEMAYYNQLVGGPQRAVNVVSVGWGLGLDQAGRYLAAQPDACEKPIATAYPHVVAAYVCSENEVVMTSTDVVVNSAGYLILYVNHIQRQIEPEVTAMFLGKVEPVHTVSIHGLDYAYIYKITPEQRAILLKERAEQFDASQAINQ